MQDSDELTAFLGEWGPFQKTIFFSLSILIIPNGYTSLSMVFVADTPQHHCRLSNSTTISPGGRSPFNLSLQLPVEERNGERVASQCTQFKPRAGERFNDTAGETEPCTDGWVYSTDRYISTIVSEWNLVCDDKWKGPFTASVFFFGMLCGSLISGQVSDRYGRKIILFISMAVHAVFSIFLVTAQSWEMFAILYFIVGLAQITRYIVMFILGSEILGKAERIAFGTVGACLFVAVGYVILPIFAYFIRDWRVLLVALSLPQILYVPLWWFIPESPRWLLSQGRDTEAKAILQAAAQRNGITTTAEILENIIDQECMSGILAHVGVWSAIITHGRIGSIGLYFNNFLPGAPGYLLPHYSQLPTGDIRTVTYLDLVRTSNIRNVTVVSVLVWMIASVGYYGLSFNTPNMHGNPYVNCFICAAAEMASYVITWILLRTSPRRISIACIVGCSGVMLLLTQIIPPSHYVLTVIMAMVGKFGYSAVFSMIYVFSAELYPTVVRSMGIAACSMASMIATIISPYIAYLGTHNKILPFVLMGSLSIAAGILCLVLPETYGQPLPQTIDQVKPIICCATTRDYIIVAEKDNVENEQGLDSQKGAV